MTPISSSETRKRTRLPKTVCSSAQAELRRCYPTFTHWGRQRDWAKHPNAPRESFTRRDIAERPCVGDFGREANSWALHLRRTSYRSGGEQCGVLGMDYLDSVAP